MPDEQLSPMARSPCSPPRIAKRLTKRLTKRLVLATLIAAACDHPTVVRPDFAYDPTQLTGGQLYRWSTGARVRVFVEPMAAGSLELAGAVQRAVVAWNAVPQEREFTLDVVTNRNLADVIVYDRSIPQPVVSGSCPFSPSGAAGYTYFCPLNGRAERLRPLASTGLTTAIVIRVDMTTTATQAALDALVAHEVGHAVGIGGHSPQTTDVMYTRPTVRTPTDRDRNTLRNVLGRAADITL
jgi:predicted Zn-dependent protease